MPCWWKRQNSHIEKMQEDSDKESNFDKGNIKRIWDKEFLKMKSTFFAFDKKSAAFNLKSLCKEHSKLYCNKKVRLARKQIPHLAGWKTWEIVKK